jgi:hypothetical protein
MTHKTTDNKPRYLIHCPGRVYCRLTHAVYNRTDDGIEILSYRRGENGLTETVNTVFKGREGREMWERINAHAERCVVAWDGLSRALKSKN